MSSPLAGFPLLSELSDENRKVLEGYLEPRELDAGSVLFHSGEEADALYFAIEGTFTIRAEGQSLAELGPGEVLGALSLVSIGKRECDAVCATPTRVMSLTREHYLRLRDDAPGLALRLQEAVLRSYASLVRGVVGDSRSPAPALS
ncbi:MAG TPA: cyclic nucleotide-binding domain-containing protein [Myxococcota bacterium]|nr:cyclic nucleotide-binding domain-containing protein [Myxococcota bacterium]